MPEIIKVDCGEWIFPSRDSSTRVKYPIDFPLVVEIYQPKKRQGKVVSSDWRINAHLTGPRYLEIAVADNQSSIQLLALKNSEEEEFVRQLDDIIPFALDELPRTRELPVEKSDDSSAIFFADVILLAYICGHKLPDGIVFRKATIPEIESLGRW